MTDQPERLRDHGIEVDRDAAVVSLRLARRKLTKSSQGLRVWRTEQADLAIPANRLAVIVCDMWDRHWSTGACLRADQLAPKIDRFCRRLRDAGALIVHAPSETIEAYRDSPARLRIAGYGPAPKPKPVARPPMPMEPGNGGSDTDESLEPGTPVWSQQHPAIDIETDCDVITDDGRELVAYLRAHNRDIILMTGVHANMCILRRSFGLVALVGHGLSPVLVADLTDAMYDPADPPYVDHDAGNQLVIGYIEAFIAPTAYSGEVVISL
jgi:nicotinamidase-related amidase